MNSEKPENSVDPQTVGAVALGVAAGMVVADRLTRSTREVASVALLGVGLVATLPFLTDYVAKKLNAPTHRFGSKKTLDGIRRSGVTDFSLEDSDSQRQPVSA